VLRGRDAWSGHEQGTMRSVAPTWGADTADRERLTVPQHGKARTSAERKVS
jgi:hypothetical protein